MEELKNDWCFVKCTKKELINSKWFYVCIYSNGLIEKEFLREFTKDIPTVITNEKLKSFKYETQNEDLIRANKSSY